MEIRVGTQGQPKSSENTMFSAMAGPFACLDFGEWSLSRAPDQAQQPRSTVIGALQRFLLEEALANCSRREVLKMTTGIVGRKRGMTRVFTDDGVSIPVTVIEAQPNRITQVKTVDALMKLELPAGVDVQIKLN